MNRHVILSRFIIGITVAVSACAPAPDQNEENLEQASLEGSTDLLSAGVSLDHITIAVADLEAAVRHWNEQLGFSIKPGRLHTNTIRNMHMKFADGTALELITADRPADTLAARYRRLIGRGDGPGFLALRPDTLERIARHLEGAGFQIHQSSGSYFRSIEFEADGPYGAWFFITLTAAAVDLPEHVTHANGSETLYAAWVRRPEIGLENRLGSVLGLTIRPAAVALPHGIVADELHLDGSRLYLISSADALGDRSVVGATVTVASIATVWALLQRGGIDPDSGSDARGRYVRVEPSRANGTWLEFLELSEASRRDARE